MNRCSSSVFSVWLKHCWLSSPVLNRARFVQFVFRHQTEVWSEAGEDFTSVTVRHVEASSVLKKGKRFAAFCTRNIFRPERTFETRLSNRFQPREDSQRWCVDKLRVSCFPASNNQFLIKHKLKKSSTQREKEQRCVHERRVTERDTCWRVNVDLIDYFATQTDYGTVRGGDVMKKRMKRLRFERESIKMFVCVYVKQASFKSLVINSQRTITDLMFPVWLSEQKTLNLPIKRLSGGADRQLIQPIRKPRLGL